MSAGPRVVTIGAVATAGPEGIAGDAAVLADLGGTPACVATSVLASAGETIHAFEPLPASLVARQIEAAMALGPVDGVKIGAVCGAAQVEPLAAAVARMGAERSVYAPVVRVAGTRTLDDATRDAAQRLLFPAVRVVIVRASDLPELGAVEIENLDGVPAAASALRAAGARTVLVAGFLSRGRVYDLLDDDGAVSIVDGARIHAPWIPGLAGAHAAALAAHLARGTPLRGAAEAAQRYVALRLTRGR